MMMLCVGVLLFAIVGNSENAGAEEGAKVELLSVRKIWDKATHNAFTDLVKHQGRWWCVFREGKGHVSSDGSLRIITSNDGISWQSAALLSSRIEDLRDPKITITPEGDFQLIAAGVLSKARMGRTQQTYVWFSKDGFSWSEPNPIADSNFWLWRVTWYKGFCYGFGYHGSGKKTIQFYRSQNGADFEAPQEEIYDEGYPTEASMIFLQDDTALCLLRRNPANALLGMAQPPYLDWKWDDVGRRIGGPNMILLPDGRVIATVRLYDGNVRTSLCWVFPKTGRIEEFYQLPSGGDTGYAGLFWDKDILWVSYYSSHEGKAAIYLAQVKIAENDKK